MRTSTIPASLGSASPSAFLHSVIATDASRAESGSSACRIRYSPCRSAADACATRAPACAGRGGGSRTPPHRGGGLAWRRLASSAPGLGEPGFERGECLFRDFEARSRGIRVIIAGAGGAAHLPGMLAAKTTVPVLGVPVASRHLQGVDSLHSIVQMPKGIPVATFAIGTAGAANAALFAVAMLATEQPELRTRLEAYRARQTEAARAMTADLK